MHPTVQADGTFHYWYSGVLAPNAVFEVSDKMGQLVWRHAAITSLTTSIPLPRLSCGWYSVRLNNARQSYTSFFYQK